MATNTTINGKKYFRIVRNVDGQRKQFYGSSKADAEDKYEEYIRSRDAHTRLSVAHTTTFGELAEEYVNEILSVSQKYASGTINRYRSAYNTHIKDKDITKLRIDDVTASDIQKMYNRLNVSMQTMKTVHKFMSAFYKWLVRNGYASDVIGAVEIPKKKDNSMHSEIVTWTDDEVKAILTALDTPTSLSQRFRATFMVKVLLYTGMRISEVLSLRYSDIRDNIIHVDRQYYLGELKEPKWGSKRQIPMHEELIRSIPKHIEWQNAEMKRKGYETEYLFTTKNGNLYSASSVRKMLVTMCEKIGIEYKHIHAYRATFCTQMCRCGVSLEVTSKLMGHKSLDVTAAHYALVSQKTKENAIQRLHF